MNKRKQIIGHTGIERSIAAKTAAATPSIFEPLESRQLFSVAIQGPSLVINEPSGNNNITITETSNGITSYVTVVDNKTTFHFDGDDFYSIAINTGAGNDTVRLNRTGFTDGREISAVLGGGNNSFTVADTSVPDQIFVSTGSGNDSITTGAGDDYIDAGFGNDTVVTNAGNDYIDAGGGNNKVFAGAGDDQIGFFPNGFDSLYGGDGNDSGANYDDHQLSANGTDIPFEIFNEGYEGVDYHDTDQTDLGALENPAGFHRSDTGVDTEDGFVNYVHTGEWLNYTITVPATGVYDLSIHGGSHFSSGGTMHMNCDGANVTGAMTVPGLVNDAYPTWTTSGIHLTAGTHVMTMYFDQEDSSGFVGDFNTFRLTQATTGTLSGNVFNDANQNHTQQQTENGIAGARVYLDTNNNGIFDAGEPTTLTNSLGQYSFNSIKDGTYHVRVAAPGGYRLATGAATEVDARVTAEATTTVNFGLTSKPVMSGRVFADTNGNGKLDSSEKGLGSWLVYVDMNNNGVFDPTTDFSTTTDANGNFSFGTLKAGTYTLRVLGPAGYKQTTPAANAPLHVTATAGQIINAGVFGEQKIA